MKRMRTLTDAFAYYGGAKAANSRWGWAAQSDDGLIVVLTMWFDQMSIEAGRLTYQAVAVPGEDGWVKRAGNRDRARKLKHAQQFCDGSFVPVFVEASSSTERVRSTRSRYIPDQNIVMKIENFDDCTGEFSARSVDPVEDQQLIMKIEALKTR